MGLNMLPDGYPSPKFKASAVDIDGNEKTVTLTEWWYANEKVESIEKSVDNYFYDAFDKGYFKVTSISEVK